MLKAIIVDDQQSICWGLKKLCQRLQWDAEIYSSMEDFLAAYPTGDGQDLSASAPKKPSAIFLDVRLPGMDGLAGTEEVRKRWGDIPVVIMTAFGDLQTAIKSVKIQAFEYLVKPFELKAVQEILTQISELESTTKKNESPSSQTSNPNEGFIGKSAPMQEVFKKIAQTTKLDTPVFISGESGTGKELTARSIHQFGTRSDKSFIPVNIAALNPNLVESELFGHVAGAFTGAASDRPGFIEQANGGTLFLDEVADIPLDLQVKLLRVLDQGEVIRVGDRESRTVDFRLISATHQNLKEKVRLGEFRHDLYYRICSFQIDLPPLREHLDDLPLLLRSFLDQIRPSGNITWTEDFLAELRRRSWPGNIRQLRTAVEHAVVAARSDVLCAADLPEEQAGLGLGDTTSNSSQKELIWTPQALQELANQIDQRFRHGQLSQEDLQNFVAELVKTWTRYKLSQPDEGKIYSEFLSWIESPLIRQTVQLCDGQALAAARKLGIHRTTVKKKLTQGQQISP